LVDVPHPVWLFHLGRPWSFQPWRDVYLNRLTEL